MTDEIKKNLNGITYIIDCDLVEKLQTKNIDAIHEIESAIENFQKIYDERKISEGQGTKE
jgi:flagellin-specific chaperone FliS